MPDLTLHRTLKELIVEVDIKESLGNLGLKITGITNDSRKVEKGTLFVAIKGTADDGHRYIPEAVKKGAAAVVVSEPPRADCKIPQIRVDDPRKTLALLAARYYGEPSRSLRVIGVTGTNGKTTLTYLIESVLRAAGRSPGVVGTIETRFGGRTLPADTTTPESVDLQRLLSEMRGEGVTDVVMEVSSHALEQGRVGQIHFDVGVFTNLSQDHLDYHQTLENYFASKRRLFTDFLPASEKKDRFAVLNMEDPRSETLLEACGSVLHPVRTGRTGPYEVTTLSHQLSAGGIVAEVMTQNGPMAVRSSLLGVFNLENILLAIGVGLSLGIPTEAMAQGIEDLKGIPGRLERIPNRRGVLIYVDYAHTPDALAGVGETLKRLAPGRILTVFGCGGDRDRTKRPLMGMRVAGFTDLAVVTSDNPRSEDPELIIDEILPGFTQVGFPRERIFRIVDRRKAIEKALELARRGDLILIAGKGHEEIQIIGKKKNRFSDQETVREILNET